MIATTVAVCIAVVLAILLVVAFVVGRRGRAEARRTSLQTATGVEQLAASRQRLHDVEDELQKVRSELDARPPVPAPAAEAAEASEATSPGVDGVISPGTDEHLMASLWAIERMELEVQRRREAVLTGVTVDIGAGVLVGALGREVERIREEMGTPGELHSDPHDDLDGRSGLVLLGAVRLTLGALARHCEAYDLYLNPGPERLEVTVTCEGFEPGSGEEISAAVDAIAASVAPVGGTAVWSPGADGAATAELGFPTV